MLLRGLNLDQQNMANFKRYAALTSVLLTFKLAAPASAEAASPNEATASPHAEPKSAEATTHGLERKFSVMAGLSQWLLFRGGNVALEYKIGRFAFEISHGQGLDLNQVGGFALSSAERDKGTLVRVPWT